jgi:hypothetical protein
MAMDRPVSSFKRSSVYTLVPTFPLRLFAGRKKWRAWQALAENLPKSPATEQREGRRHAA